MPIFLPLFYIFVTTLHAFDIPYLSGTVVDEVQLLNRSEISEIDSRIREIQKRTSVQMALLIARSLQDLTIEEYSIKVADAWKLGKKGTDRGLLFVIAPQERRMRLEVGYGIEGELPDAITKRILDDGVVPYFKRKHFGKGILLGLDWIEARLEKREFIEPLPNRRQRSTGPVFFFLMVALFIVIIILRALFSPFQRSYWRGYDHWGNSSGGGSWGGGWGGGGGWSGGGGGFGGGGSSSSW